jgi:transposase-like protein
MSAGVKGVCFMAVRKRRSKWNEALRQRIVAEAEASDEPMSEVAKRHGLNPKLLYSWRQKYIKDRDTVTGKEVCLLPVEVKAAQDETPVKANNPTSGILEIVLPCGSQLRCDNDIDPAFLTIALAELKPNNPSTVP